MFLPTIEPLDTSVQCSSRVLLVLSGFRLDYANVILVGVSAKNFKHIQCIQNTRADRLLTERCCISISNTLKELHWQLVKWWIEYEVATMTFKLSRVQWAGDLWSSVSFKVPQRFLRSSADDWRLEKYPLHTKLELQLFVVLPQLSGMHCCTASEALHLSLSIFRIRLGYTFWLAFD